MWQCCVREAEIVVDSCDGRVRFERFWEGEMIGGVWELGVFLIFEEGSMWREIEGIGEEGKVTP